MADEADYDGDGIATSVEYFLGLSPVTADPSPVSINVTQPVPGLISLQMDYPIPMDRPDFTGFPESSPDLSSWTSSGLSISNNFQSGRVEVRQTIAASRGFLRLRVEPAAL